MRLQQPLEETAMMPSMRDRGGLRFEVLRLANTALGLASIAVLLVACSPQPSCSLTPANATLPAAAVAIDAGSAAPSSIAVPVVIECSQEGLQGFVRAAQATLRPVFEACFALSKGPFAGDWGRVTGTVTLSDGRLVEWKVDVAGSTQARLRRCVEERLAGLAVANCTGNRGLRWTTWLGTREPTEIGECCSPAEERALGEPCFQQALRRLPQKVRQGAARCFPGGGAASALGNVRLLFDDAGNDRVTAVEGPPGSSSGTCWLAMALTTHPQCLGTENVEIQFRRPE